MISAAPARMYGPPPCRKRKVIWQGGLRKCIRPLAECTTPGQDGMRYALFLFSSSVLGDCLAHQARRASGSTVVPSQLFASRPGRKTRLDRRRWVVDADGESDSKPDVRQASSASRLGWVPIPSARRVDKPRLSPEPPRRFGPFCLRERPQRHCGASAWQCSLSMF